MKSRSAFPRNRFICFLVILSTLILHTTASTTQKFVDKPSHTSVKLGDTTTLKCSVSGNHGDVQWTHDGTALGYDRKVPGKPRYSVIYENNEATEYHLKIENVTMDDEGTFSCQAAPIGDWDTTLEAKAKLTVLVGPQQAPEIVFQDELRRPGEIVHFRAMSETPTKYTCIVRKAKPAGIVKWFLNETLISTKDGTIKNMITKHGKLSDLNKT